MNWQQFVLENEVGIRLGFFFGIFGLMVVWELLAPRRALTVSKTLRWVNNLGLVFLNSFVLRLLFPAAAVGVAAWAQRQGWGLLNQFHTARAVSRHPGAMAAAPCPPCRSRLRRHHRCPLSYHRDHPLHAHQVRHHRPAGAGGGGRGGLRGDAQRHRHVQPNVINLVPNSLFCLKISSIHHHLKESDMSLVPAVPTTDQAVFQKII